MSITGVGARTDPWTRAWHDIGHRVAGLLENPQPVPVDLLPLAVASNAATIRSLVTVHRDLTRRETANRPTGDAKATGAGTASSERITVELLETNPVRALGIALDRHPATPGVALSDVLTTNPPPGPARLWHDLARAAVVAADVWRNADPASRPHRDQAWSLMADVAAIGQGLAHLDDDIARAATRMPHAVQVQLGTTPGVLSDRYAAAATAGLRAAGERTRHLAAQGPLPDVAPLRQPFTRPAAVRLPAHVPYAQAATVELLDRATGPVSPRDLTYLTRAQARLAEHAVRLTDDPVLAHAARQHTAQLHAVTARQLQTVEPASDQRALHQAQALLTYLAGMDTAHPDSGRVAAAIARSQPDVVDALHRAARHQLAAGTWLVPNPNERATSSIWVRQAPQSEWQPDLVHRLVEARTTAHTLAQAGGPNPFPDTDAAVAVATAWQGLPPRLAVNPPPFRPTTARPTAPSRATNRAHDVER
ncbi:hypothetical protein [Aquipuribacter hungaricus]|uniref:DUF222 domain-containing protein n=1 Tax=Aquipuribacter hungaricus TaxID=545624 RepID=A0ABV7WLJ6_9MICO